jgi:hypothetical protein
MGKNDPQDRNWENELDEIENDLLKRLMKNGPRPSLTWDRDIVIGWSLSWRNSCGPC